MFIFRFIFYFCLTFVILSFRIGDKPIFNYIDNLTHPLVAKLYSSLGSKGKEILKEGGNIPKKLLGNTLPDSKNEIPVKGKKVTPSLATESYTPEEKESIKKIFEKAN